MVAKREEWRLLMRQQWLGTAAVKDD